MQFLTLALSTLMLALQCNAQFFWDNMFQQGQPQQPQNVPSDSSLYQQRYTESRCDNYLCPGTLACVAVPHHCPCAWHANEDKVEFGEGSMACVSKGGFKAGEAARKIELARKGLL